MGEFSIKRDPTKMLPTIHSDTIVPSSSNWRNIFGKFGGSQKKHSGTALES